MIYAFPKSAPNRGAAAHRAVRGGVEVRAELGIVNGQDSRMNETFTPEAEACWQLVPVWAQKIVLTNVWCRQCRDRTTMIQVSGEMIEGDLLLTGICTVCGAKIVRLVEGG